MGLLDGEIRQIIGQATDFLMLKGMLHTVVLTDDGQGGQSKADVNVPCRGFIESWNAGYNSRFGIAQCDSVLMLLQDGLAATPRESSQVTLRGQRWAVGSPVAQDPAQATWVLGCNPVGAVIE